MFRDPTFLTGKRSFFKSCPCAIPPCSSDRGEGGAVYSRRTGKRKVETNAPAPVRAAGREFHGKGKRHVPERTVPVCEMPKGQRVSARVKAHPTTSYPLPQPKRRDTWIGEEGSGCDPTAPTLPHLDRRMDGGKGRGGGGERRLQSASV